MRFFKSNNSGSSNLISIFQWVNKTFYHPSFTSSKYAWYPLNYRRAGKEIALGVVVATLIDIPIQNFIAIAQSKYNYNLPTSDPDISHDMLSPAFAAHVCISAPIQEEVIFRGVIFMPYIYAARVYKFPPKLAVFGAITTSTAAFVSCHSEYRKPAAYTGGLLFAAVTMLCGGSLWASTAAHITNNSLGYLLIKARERDKYPSISPP